MTYRPMKCWALAWDAKRGSYICTIISYSRCSLIKAAEEYMDELWPNIYEKGGRAIKVTISEVPHAPRS